MKKAFLFVSITIVVTALSCSKRDNRTVDVLQKIEMDSCIPSTPVCLLKENLNYISEIASFYVINDSQFVVSSVNPAQVLLYNIHGDQVLQIGKSGNGPNEYISPAIIRAYNNQIYVWCNMRLKLIVFDCNGKPIVEYTNFTKGIKDFCICDNLLCIYSSGGFDDPMVQFYDLETRKFNGKGFGEQTNEHKILNAYMCSGGLAFSKAQLLFAPNDAPTIYMVDIRDFTIKEMAINDPGFAIERVDENPVVFMADMLKSTAYIFGSDIITGLYATASHFIVTAEVGKIELEGLRFKDVSKRRQQFYILDKKLNLLYCIRSKPWEGSNPCLYASFSDDLYAIKYNIKDEVYQLHKLILERGK